MKGVRRRAKQFVRNLSAAICIIACLFLGVMPGMVGAEQPEPLPPSTECHRGTEPRQIPTLPPEVAFEVDRIEDEVNAVLNHGEDRSPEDLHSLIRAAELAVGLRTQHQGKTWWKTIWAHINLQDLQTWLTLSAESRAAWREASALDKQIGELHQRGQYAEALSLAQRVLAIWEKVLGPDHPYTAHSLNNLAVLYETQGQYTQALLHAQRALAIREKVLGCNHPQTATSLNILASLYVDQGRYTEAQSVYEQALGIREKVLGPDHPNTANSLNNLAELYQRQGQYAQAVLLYRRAMAIHEKVLGPDHPDTATSLNNLASLYVDQGRYTEVQSVHEQALAIKEKVLGLDHPDTAASLSNLAALYAAQGEYAKALPLYQRELAIREQAFGPNHPDTATNFNNLAVLYHAQREYAQALPLAQRALAIREKVLGPNHLDTAIGMENLALMKLAVQPDEATAQLLLRAIQAKWRHLTRTFPMLSTAAQQQFLAKSKLLTTQHLFWPLFTALPTLDRAIGFQATLLSKQLVAEATRQESHTLRQVLTDAPPAWQILWHQREDLRRQYATRALQDLQNDPTRPRRVAQQSTNDPNSSRQLSDQIDQLEQQLRRDYPAYAAQAQLEQISVEQVRASLRPQDLLLEYIQFNPYDSQAKTLTDTQHYGVYVVRGDRNPIVAIDLGEAAPIDAAVAQVQRHMRILIEQTKQMALSRKQLRQAEAELAEISSTLRTLIWAPLEAHLNGIHRVYVAPEGQLSLVPFEMLPKKTKQGGWRYLVEDQELIYLNTGRDLVRLASTRVTPSSSTPATKQAALIGNPAFWATPPDVARAIAALPSSTPTVVAQHDSNGSSPTLGLAETSPRLDVPRRWPNVPELGTLLQASKQQLTRHGWDVTMIEQQKAVEEAVLRVQAPRLLQLATHGYLLDPVGPDAQRQDNPLLRSMLLFSGVNQADPAQAIFYRVGGDVLAEADARKRGLSDNDLQQVRIDIGDGILTAYEVTGMNLQGTELVNLTACETGLGQVTPDGVMGLRQAFLLAGARALTLSMWEVPAEETTKQIAGFYERWLGTKKSTKKNQKKTKNQPAPTHYGAFRQTQLATLAAARATRNGVGHPFFWAGTIYLGDPGDLPSISTRPVSQP